MSCRLCFVSAGVTCQFQSSFLETTQLASQFCWKLTLYLMSSTYVSSWLLNQYFRHSNCSITHSPAIPYYLESLLTNLQMAVPYRGGSCGILEYLSVYNCQKEKVKRSCDLVPSTSVDSYVWMQFSIRICQKYISTLRMYGLYLEHCQIHLRNEKGIMEIVL